MKRTNGVLGPFDNQEEHQEFLQSKLSGDSAAVNAQRRAIAGLASAASSSCSAVPMTQLRFGMGGQLAAYSAIEYIAGTKTATKLKGNPMLKDLAKAIYLHYYPGNERPSGPIYKEIKRQLLYPASAQPNGVTLLADVVEVIAWARNEVGASANEVLNRAFFHDEDRATNQQLCEWIVFYAKVLLKIEQWSIADGRVYKSRLPLPLYSIRRLHTLVDKLLLHSILRMTEHMYKSSLAEVNDERKRHNEERKEGEEPIESISWESLDGVPSLGRQAQFVARGGNAPKQWLEFILDLRGFNGPDCNKIFHFTGAFFTSDGVQLVIYYNPKKLNLPSQLEVGSKVSDDAEDQGESANEDNEVWEEVHISQRDQSVLEGFEEEKHEGEDDAEHDDDYEQQEEDDISNLSSALGSVVIEVNFSFCSAFRALHMFMLSYESHHDCFYLFRPVHIPLWRRSRRMTTTPLARQLRMPLPTR